MSESREMSKSEVARFTRAQTKAGQTAMLRNNGIRHYLDAHGWPVVLWSAVEGGDANPGAVKSWKPNKAA